MCLNFFRHADKQGIQKKQKECTDKWQAVKSIQAHRELIYYLAETFLALSMRALFFTSEDPKLIRCQFLIIGELEQFDLCKNRWQVNCAMSKGRKGIEF